MKEDFEKNDGFRSKAERNKFAKIMVIILVYQQFFEWDALVLNEMKENCQKQAEKMKLPDGWDSLGSYEIAKQWFFKNYR